uniref:C2H2-type domain-containing protein n=1 Tax=Periophthalmus magnuspinnatus TaxID=409849 RepID=A0A3B4ARG2_9GOBI
MPRSITILSPPKTTDSQPLPPTPSSFIVKSGPAHVTSAPSNVPPTLPQLNVAPNRSLVTISQPRLVTIPPSGPSLSSGSSISSAPSLSSDPCDPSDPSRVVMSVEEFYYGSYEGDERLRDIHKYTAMLQKIHLCCVSGLCRICEWAFDNEPVFLNHMKSNHKPGEMPYICQVCCYRSSFYSDVIQHFATFHRETRFLLCVFCLKILKNSENYQQHLLRHQHEAFHCNRCRLQFIYLKEKVHHKTEHHRSYRRPAQLEGLPPGSKVTPMHTLSHTNPAHSNMIQPITIKTEPHTASSCLWRCVECGDQVVALSAHYPTHVRCLLCSFGTCCSKAYASHMILRFSVICSDCRFRTLSGDEMAVHLALNPTHCSAMCKPRSETRTHRATWAHTESHVTTRTLSHEPTHRSMSTHTQIHEPLLFCRGQISFVAPKKEAGLSAPIEESDEEDEEFKPERLERVESPESIDQSFPSVLQQLFSERQLQVVLCALCEGMSEATRVYATEPRLIRRWLREANANIHPDPESERAEPEEAEHEGTKRLVKFVLSMREQEAALSYTGLFNKLSSLRQKGLHSLRFSYDWAVSFMLRAKLQFQGVGTRVSQQLPLELKQRVTVFQTFIQKVIQGHALSSSAVATMDELCLFTDLTLLQTRASDVLQMTGTCPLVTVYLTALSDGTLLPALALTGTRLDENSLPEFVLTDAIPENTKEALELWRSRVWTEHVRDLKLQKSVLIVDAHREHAADVFVAALSESGTLPAVIPKGLNFKLHPLEICVKPLLQRYLLWKWRTLPAGPATVLHQDNIAQMLVEWTVKALSHITALPEVIQRSFRVAGVLGEKEEEEGLQQVQDELMKKLSLKMADMEMGWDQEQKEKPGGRRREDLVVRLDSLQEQNQSCSLLFPQTSTVSQNVMGLYFTTMFCEQKLLFKLS